MKPAEGLVRVGMLRPSLEDLPAHELPAGFSLRGYRPGDVEHWVRIVGGADLHQPITEALWGREFGEDEAEVARRQLFLCAADGRPVGTGTAWFRRCAQGAREGRVHWLAILPEWQGRGLAKPLLGAVCLRLRELGHREAGLTTETVRTVALRLYLKFGFVPDLRRQGDLRAWQDLEATGLPVVVTPLGLV